MPAEGVAPRRRPERGLSSNVTAVTERPSVIERRKRVVRVELDADLLEALAVEAEERCTTAPLLIAMLLRERAEV